MLSITIYINSTHIFKTEQIINVLIVKLIRPTWEFNLHNTFNI